MKKLILAAVMAVSLNATASTPVDPCLTLKVTAESIMSARQGGVDVTVVVELFRKGTSEDLFKAAMNLITDAYNQPRFNTKKYKDEAIQEFANDYYIACWTGVA